MAHEPAVARHGDADRERGQLTIAVAGVLALLVGAIAGIALIGTAMVERHAATVAADAVALADVADSQAGAALRTWYEGHRIDTSASAGEATARTGDAEAHSRAAASTDVVDAPAMVAVVERARQLVRAPLRSARIRGTQVTFEAHDAALFSGVASDLVVCEVAASAGSSPSGGRTWQLC